MKLRQSIQFFALFSIVVFAAATFFYWNWFGYA